MGLLSEDLFPPIWGLSGSWLPTTPPAWRVGSEIRAPDTLVDITSYATADGGSIPPVSMTNRPICRAFRLCESVDLSSVGARLTADVAPLAAMVAQRLGPHGAQGSAGGLTRGRLPACTSTMAADARDGLGSHRGAARGAGGARTPVAPDGGVVVRVHATGLCRSDWHALGRARRDQPAARARARVGRGRRGDRRGVARWSAGDRVTVPFVAGLRALRVVPVRGRAGLPRPAAAWFHALGLVRGVRRRCTPPTRT